MQRYDFAEDKLLMTFDEYRGTLAGAVILGMVIGVIAGLSWVWL